jgi:hypothetical protein
MAATSTTISNFDPALKQLYREKRVEDLTYSRRPMLAMIPKFEDFQGRNMPIVTKFGNPQGVGATFATAQGNRSQVRTEDFLLTRVNQYSIASIDGEVAEASKGEKGAFLNAMMAVIDGAMEALADAIESYLPRSGTGSMGVAGTISTTTLTLATPEDIVNFEVGMEVTASATDGGALRSGNATVTGINRDLGTLTTDSNWTSQITSFAANDFVYRQGDEAAAGANKVISGFEAWCPSSAPTSTLFFGVDRSVDTSRLGGQRYDAATAGDSIEEGLIKGQSLACREGGAIDTYFVNHVKYRDLVLEVGSRARYDRKQAKGSGGDLAKVGFQSLVVDGDRGPIDVVAANKCQKDVAWGLELNTWLLASLGKATKILDLDNNRILRQSSADGYEVRIGFRGNAACKAPGYNVRVALSA